MAPAAETDRLRALLDGFGLPTALPAGLEPDLLLARMRLDKKAHAGGLRFVLWEGPGLARIVDGVPEDAVLETLLEG
jgi:3-dehydroquinate synthase